MTESIEPPLASTIPEKPYTLVLVEDEGLYDTSWQSSLRESLPQNYGIQYCSQSLNLSSLDSALDEMGEDFATMPSVVLLARGPLVSWVAQYYLESLPLTGLIMVDPMMMDSSPESIEEVKGLYRTKNDLHLFDQIRSGAESRPLKLEAGVVPMLVWKTSTSRVLQASADLTAERHSDETGPFGEVQVDMVAVDGHSCPELISNWIDEVM